MREALSPSRSIVHRLTPSAEGAYSDMLELLDRGEELARCYFADNDLIAAGAMRSQSPAFKVTVSPSISALPVPSNTA